MKYQIFIDKEKEEEILIYVHSKTKLIDDIEKLILCNGMEIIGHSDTKAVPLSPADIYCFIVENNKIFAITQKDKLSVKTRLYQLEEALPKSFIKINQSCLANINLIECFDASLSGTLTVKFKNGYIDYVSRRNVKKIKERLGF